VYERLNAMTEGRAWTGGVDAILDNVKATVKLATDRAHYPASHFLLP
jgi:hypothetical protein